MDSKSGRLPRCAAGPSALNQALRKVAKSYDASVRSVIASVAHRRLRNGSNIGVLLRALDHFKQIDDTGGQTWPCMKPRRVGGTA
jgi:hypothetical protein